MAAQTDYEVLDTLESIHRCRRDQYKQLVSCCTDDRARLLLQRLEELEEIAVTEIHDEHERLHPDQATYLPLGTDLTSGPTHGVDCQCGSNPTFDEALECVLSSDGPLDDLIDQLADSSAATSVQELAARLSEFERTRDRQIARFATED